MTANVSIVDHTLKISGDITLHNAMDLYRNSLSYFKQQANYAFDFSGLHSADSALIALMVEWLRLAASHGKKASFANIPSHLESMIQAANMENLFA